MGLPVIYLHGLGFGLVCRHDFYRLSTLMIRCQVTH